MNELEDNKPSKTKNGSLCLAKRLAKILIILPLLIALAFPQPALAADSTDDSGFDLWGSVSGWVGDRLSDAGDAIAHGAAPFLAGWSESLINLSINNIKTTSTKSILGKSFSNLLGKKTGGFYTTVTTVHKNFVVPVAASILSLVMLIQLIKISQRIDGSATLPAIKDIVFLIVYATIFIWLIKNSVDICAAAYDTFNDIVNGISQVKIDSLDAITVSEKVGDSPGAAGSLFVTSLAMLLASFVVKGAVSVMCYMRAIQLYVFTAFSPIPFALLGFDETKNYGISFCKNYLGICLSGAVIILALSAFPSLLSGFSGGEITGIKGEMWGSLCAVLAMTLIIIKSGTIARDILGG